MLKVFDKASAKCTICGTPVNEKYRRGNRYYCADDYQKSYEKIDTKQKQIERRKAKELLNG